MVWDGFADPPWRSLLEPDLREFLLARAAEGFVFPLNPVWPVRDPGWFAVLEALEALASRDPQARTTLDAWYPDQQVVELIKAGHLAHPNGFRKGHSGAA